MRAVWVSLVLLLGLFVFKAWWFYLSVPEPEVEYDRVTREVKAERDTIGELQVVCAAGCNVPARLICFDGESWDRCQP